MKIYTKTGDDGETGLFGGPRVRTDAPRIAAYGTVRAMAEKLGEDKAVQLLSQTLQEEEDTDVKLSDLADQIQVVGGAEEEENEPTTRTAKAKAARA